ncbi:MAG: CBS domain-containing protein [Thermoplasmata archaeon]|nr:CBS domain-containing protein [Thermoplasmata archaeon]
MIVSEVMTEKMIVAEVPGTRTDVLKLLVKRNITGVPVIKHGEKTLVGFVTRKDIFAKPDEEQLALIMRRDYPTIDPDATVEEAARLIIENDVKHLPVVVDSTLKGIVTPSDLLIAVEKSDDQTPVIKVERKPCVPIYQKAPLSVALTTFKVANVDALPVLDDNARLVGIITDRDIFNQSVIDGAVIMNDLALGEDVDNQTWAGIRNVIKLWYEVSKIELPMLSVGEVMIRNPTTVFARTPICEAARIMRKNDFGQLPLRDSKDSLIGMIYDTDVISTLIK